MTRLNCSVSHCPDLLATIKGNVPSDDSIDQFLKGPRAISEHVKECKDCSGRGKPSQVLLHFVECSDCIWLVKEKFLVENL